MGWLFVFFITPDLQRERRTSCFLCIDNRKPLEYKLFLHFIYCKIFGDKIYIGKYLFQRHFVAEIQLMVSYIT